MNKNITKEAIERVIKSLIDPYFETNLVDAGCVKAITIGDQNNCTVELVLNFPDNDYKDTLKKQYQTLLSDEFGIAANIIVTGEAIAHKVQATLKPIPNIKNIIAVASGKGGVGKSTTSVNLALALSALGARVGILDADIYGPSLPRMMGSQARPESLDNKTMEPIVVNGIQTMSIGYLIDEKDATIWRAPMAVSALTQLLEETNWKAIDYLIIDMPPGTGDIQLTMSQKIPVVGSIIVTTPQDIALLDARKGINMFQKVEVPILGIIENMSTHICSNCQHEEAIFGSDGGATLAEEAHVALLGKLPLDIRIRQALDLGKPQEASADIQNRYREIALKVMAKLSLRPKDRAAKFPKIVVEKG